MTQFYTYTHCTPNGTPFYVGKGSNKRSHSFNGDKCEKHREIVALHGKENILIKVYPAESEDAALQEEVALIKKLRGEGCDLVNIFDGGTGRSGINKFEQSILAWRDPEIYRMFKPADGSRGMRQIEIAHESGLSLSSVKRIVGQQKRLRRK